MFTPFANQNQFDPDAGAFINVTGIGGIEAVAINNLVNQLKSAGLWTKFNALYPFVGGTADTNKYNLINPQDTNAAYRLSFVGGLTHNSNGITGNGTTGYCNTNLAPANMGGGTDNAVVCAYFRNYVGRNATADFGATNNSSYIYINLRNASNISAASMNATVAQSTTSTTATSGFFTLSRTISTSFTTSINKSHTTRTRNSIAAGAQNMYLLASNNNGTAGSFSNRNCAFFGLGFGFTTDEINSLVDINQAFQTTLGRFSG